jgi:hypothetical protein
MPTFMDDGALPSANSADSLDTLFAMNPDPPPLPLMDRVGNAASQAAWQTTNRVQQAAEIAREIPGKIMRSLPPEANELANQVKDQVKQSLKRELNQVIDSGVQTVSRSAQAGLMNVVLGGAGIAGALAGSLPSNNSANSNFPFSIQPSRSSRKKPKLSDDPAPPIILN